MDSSREKILKVKNSGSFKRKVKRNFLNIYNCDVAASLQSKAAQNPQQHAEQQQIDRRPINGTIPAPIEPSTTAVNVSPCSIVCTTLNGIAVLFRNFHLQKLTITSSSRQL